MVEFVLEKRFEYGKIFLIFFAHRPYVCLADSRYVREIFIKNHKHLVKDRFIYDKIGFVYGERYAGYGLANNTDEKSWQVHRHIMNPTFHRKSLRNFMKNFNNVCDRFLVRMDAIVKEQKAISMLVEFGKATCEAISQVSFNIDTQVIENPNSKFPSAIRLAMEGVEDNLNSFLSSTLLTMFQCSFLQNEKKKRQIEAVQFVRNFASQNVEKRMDDLEKNKDVPNDLLTSLIKDGRLTMDEIVDEFLTIFVAGQETTSNSLSFLLYEILNHPHIEEKILNEANEVLGDREHMEFEDLAKFNYFNKVMEEGLRRHPAIIAPSRILSKTLEVNGFKIPSGVGIDTSQLFFSTDPEIWPNPEIFDPERFENVDHIRNFTTTHFPFSIGRRDCIGRMFAKFEIKVFMVRVLRKFKFQLLPGQTERMEAKLTIKPRDGVMCHVMRR
ncbi:cholesterol 24-hydroxylase-like [Xenia sp. Carnegie-2017]|uniref:cholesterol 24-hydroxylase-like n=1 Tax=Xenia sp. Carnegie-2017 TaxID=2897299 RepID=UPI001F03C6A9|nr:cholesterol 24-hydroxylase-like [Xenia sp. Carnegie-2017]XP_046840507.1 cholesterol 24-hydroxylase-like [Xenia sp. Carnegie-2017]